MVINSFSEYFGMCLPGSDSYYVKVYSKLSLTVASKYCFTGKNF